MPNSFILEPNCSNDSSDEDEMMPSSSSESDDSLSSGAMSEMFDDDDDESDDEKPKRRKRVCFENYCEETVQKYSDKKFVRTFRLPRDIANSLIEEYAKSEFFEAEDCRGLPKVPPHKQIYCFLWFVGHQVATYEEVTDRFNLAADTVFNIITRVADFLGSLAPNLIKWPTEEESRETQEYYERKYNIPQVEASIDGSEVKVNRPSEDADSYLNRKGFFSVKMQIVADHKHVIRSFLAGWPGVVHDARMYKRSEVPRILATKKTSGRILGDKAYPCTKHLMPPFKDNGHLLPHQTRFNKNHSKCRIDVEHTIGILKQRFRILYHMRLQPGMRRLKVIRACVVLHNMVLTRDLNYLGSACGGCSCQRCRAAANGESGSSASDESEDEDEDDDGEDDDNDGLRLRDEVAARFMN